MDVTSTALSGMNAAERRLANSANNIANVTSEGFIPKDAVQTAQEGGGVRTDLVERSPASITAEGPNGQQELPNVSLDEELVNAQVASYDYQANIQVLKRQKEMDQALLDIQA